MKNIFFCFIVFLVLSSCLKMNEEGTQEFTSELGTTLQIQSIGWKPIRLGQSSTDGGYVNLNLSGSTNANGIKFSRHLQDGTDSDTTVNLFQNNFNVSVEVSSYDQPSMPIGVFRDSTIIKVYRGTDTIKVLIRSGELSF